MRAACTGCRKPGWNATMKRSVVVARATAAAAIHGSSVIGNDGQQAADEAGRLGGPGDLDDVLDVAEAVGLAVARRRA